LQQRDVVGIDRRPLRRRCHPGGEVRIGDDAGIVRQRRMRIADRAPAVVRTDDQPVEQALLQEFQRHRQQRGEIAGDQDPRAGITQLVRQRAFAVERRQMHDAGAGLQRAEEIDRVIRQIAEVEPDRTILAVAGA